MPNFSDDQVVKTEHVAYFENDTDFQRVVTELKPVYLDEKDEKGYFKTFFRYGAALRVSNFLNSRFEEYLFWPSCEVYSPYGHDQDLFWIRFAKKNDFWGDYCGKEG